MGAKNLDSVIPTKDAPSIFGYTNYRDYLKDVYEFRKQSSRGYSYRSFSKAAGFSSPNFLKLIIDGERNLSNEAIEKFIKGLGLQKNMAEYFRTLVRMNQSKTDEEKEGHFERLGKLIPKSKRRMLEREVFQYISHWLYPVLREMVQLEDFRADPYWIARKLNHKANVNEINQAWQFLLKYGFVEKNDDGKFATKDNMVISSDEVKNLAIRNYHRQMLDQAKLSLETLDVSEREFGALIFNLPAGALDELKIKLKAFRTEIHNWALEMAETENVDTVVQMNLQMYPHTKKGKAS